MKTPEQLQTLRQTAEKTINNRVRRSAFRQGVLLSVATLSSVVAERAYFMGGERIAAVAFGIGGVAGVLASTERGLVNRKLNRIVRGYEGDVDAQTLDYTRYGDMTPMIDESSTVAPFMAAGSFMAGGALITYELNNNSSLLDPSGVGLLGGAFGLAGLAFTMISEVKSQELKKIYLKQIANIDENVQRRLTEVASV